MITKSKLFRGLSMGAFVVAMNGCSGGEGDSAALQGQSGKLIQGPVMGATVFADDISGGVHFTLGANEVSATTDESGIFTLPSVPGYNYVLVSSGGKDKLTNQPAIQMIAPAGSANVTPITTLVALDTTGSVKGKLESLMPGFKFDDDISTSASPAVLMVAKSVETMVAAMTNAVSQKATAGGSKISAAQISAIQATTMLSITQELAKSNDDLKTTVNLSTTLKAAATSAVISINTAGNITIPAATATDIADKCVKATATALSVGAIASTTTIEGGETKLINPTVADTLSNAIASVSTTAADSISATKTHDDYLPPPIQVVTPITIQPSAGSQTIGNISFSPATLNNGGTTTASASATSGLGVKFSSLTKDVCTVSSGSTIKGVTAGLCIIAADQGGNDSYSAAGQVKASLTVSKAFQSVGNISFNATTLVVGGKTTASASATPSGLGVTFTSTTPSVCTVNGSTITGIDAGTCTIAANQGGDTNYNAASQVTNNITVGKADQTITVTKTSPAGAANGSTFTVAATASSSLPVTYSSGSTAVCTNSGATFTMIAGSGTCIVNFDQAGDTAFDQASRVTNNTTASVAVIPPKTQTIANVGFNPTTLNVGGTTTASATATSGLAVTFSSSTAAVCTVSGTAVTGVTAGTCTIAANQSGDANNIAAPQVTKDITIGKAAQTISVTTTAPVSATVNTNNPFTVAASASSNLPVTYSSGSPSVCTNNGATFTVIQPGNCVVQYGQSGNANYAAAPQVINNTSVNKLGQTIGLVTFGTKGGNTITVSASATSTLAVAFISTTPGVCTVSGATVTAVTAGACTIAADQSGNAFYNAAGRVFGTVNPIQTTGATGGTGGSTGGTGINF